MKILCAVLLVGVPLIVLASPALADDAWVATHSLFRGDIVHTQDVAKKSMTRLPFEAVPTSQSIVGLEVKQSIYAGRAVTKRDVGPPSLVKVSTQVEVIWKAPGIELQLNGRALDTGALGDEVRVLNPGTSRTIRGKVIAQGVVEVPGTP